MFAVLLFLQQLLLIFILLTGNGTLRWSTRNSMRPPCLANGSSYAHIVSLNQTALMESPSIRSANTSILPRVLTPTEYDILQTLVFDVTRILEKHNISFVLTYGSLLGSYFMHGILPWDDDVDIFAHNNSKATILDIFKDCKLMHICSYNQYHNPGMMVKLYQRNRPQAGETPWTWPFVDIVFYHVSNGYVMAVDRVSKLEVPISSFFPFHARPFGSLWLPVPNKPWILLRKKYRKFKCASGTWNHRSEIQQTKTVVRCTALLQHYPFVWRTMEGNITTETLKRNGQALYSVKVNQFYRQQRSVFDFWWHYGDI